jgi:hypothetical protein
MVLKIEILQKKPFPLRLDVLPFVFLYLITYFWLSQLTDQLISDLLLLVILFANCVVHLMAHWSQTLKKAIQFSSKKEIRGCRQLFYTEIKKVTKI